MGIDAASYYASTDTVRISFSPVFPGLIGVTELGASDGVVCDYAVVAYGQRKLVAVDIAHASRRLACDFGHPPTPPQRNPTSRQVPGAPDYMDVDMDGSGEGCCSGGRGGGESSAAGQSFGVVGGVGGSSLCAGGMECSERQAGGAPEAGAPAAKRRHSHPDERHSAKASDW